MRSFPLSLLIVALAAVSPAQALVAAVDPATGTALETALKSPHRDTGNAARDVYRHPTQTLGFFGLKSDMTIVEIAPGGGWYTEILAPVLRDKGKLLCIVGSPNGQGRRGFANYLTKLNKTPAVYDKVQLVISTPEDGYAPDGSVDMVLTFRNVHNWMAAGTTDKVFAKAYKALKPGGVFGVVEHRWPENKPQDPKAENGYVKESVVIAFAEAAGFKLAGRSEINANPKDSKDYVQGVWTLPPVFAEGEKDKAKYQAIGESDRMTLKFVKP